MDKNISFMKEYKDLLEKTIIPSEDRFRELYEPLDTLVKQNMKPLFRFRAYSDNSVGAFRDDKIFHSKPITFNDPHDCLLYFDIAKLQRKIANTFNVPHLIESWNIIKDDKSLPEEIQNRMLQIQNAGIKVDSDTLTEKTTELKLLEKQFTSILQCAIDGIHTNARNHPRIACFSENINSTLMWAHYADYHKGFAIEYDFSNTQTYCETCGNANKCPNFATMQILPIIYSNERFDATLLTEIFAEYEIARRLGVNISLNIQDRLAWTKSNIYKSLDWSYEQEWRSILNCQNQEKVSVSMKPKAVYLGCNMSFEHESVVIRYAIEKGISINKMKTANSNRGFELISEPYHINLCEEVMPNEA